MADIIGALQRRQKSLVLAFTASVLVAVAVLEVADLWWRREQTLKAAEFRAGNLAFVLSEYVRGSFAVADTSLRQLAIHARRVGGAAAPAQAWDAILYSARTALPGSGSISVTDADGVIRRSTLPAIVGQSRRDNYLFKELSTLDRDDLVVDRPLLTVIPPKRFVIPIGRRLTTEVGTFEGTVVATVMPEAYRGFFRTVDVGRDGIIWVFHPDGIVLFREPSATDPIGEVATDNPVLQAAQRSRSDGVIEGPLQDRGPQFVSAYRTGHAPPLIVAVSLSRAEILADWRDQRRTSALAVGALALTLGGLVLVLFRQINARTKAEQDLVEMQRLEAFRLRDSNDRLEQALDREQRARRESEAASHLKDEFLMTVSHELRTPLTAIYGWVRMLASDSIARGDRRKALAVVERNARAQMRLIEDLLDVSRGISGKLRIDARGVNVSDVVLAAVETLGPALEAKAIRFERSVEADMDPILADPDRLQQIVWNLLSNAIKFTPEGGTVQLRVARVDSKREGTGPATWQPRATTSTGSAGADSRNEVVASAGAAPRALRNIEIVVSDTGVGIGPDFLPYVFQRFRQSDAGTRRRYGGLGLGLAIVRQLVELHGGTVTADSAGEGKGATFRVLLPARAVRSDMQPSQVLEHARPGSRGPVRLDDVRVLVVDDEPDARELFVSILEGAGAKVLTASSAADAMRILADQDAHVLLSDIEMPGEDGYQLLQRALAEARARDRRLVTVAVTAYARGVDRRRALDAGFDRHLAKPVEPAELVSVISSLVNARARGEFRVH